MMRNLKYIVELLVIVLMIAGQSCSEGFLDEYPSDSQSPDNIQTLSDTRIVLNGAYNGFQDNGYYGANIITDNDCRADDMQTAEWGRIDNEYLYEYTAQGSDVDTWSVPYWLLRHVNSMLSFIDGIETVTDDEAAEKLDIKGQALTIRALAHFDLCRQFGRQYSHDNGASLGVPILTRVPDPYEKLPRNTVAEVYAQVIADLKEAIPLLSTGKRLGKMNAWAAKTLLARVYLYMEDNENAYTTAVDIIDNSPYSLMARADYVDSWSNSSGSSEAIFSVMNNESDNSGLEGVANLSDPEGYGQFIASQDLIDLIRSDPDDIRNEMLYIDQTSDPVADATWGRVLKYPGNGNTKAIIVAHQESGSPLVGSAYIGNVSILRLSEVYLIAAEAAIKNTDAANATTYLNAIVERANPAATVAQVDVDLDRILTERRKELCAEGHRFFDLIRNKRDIIRSNSARIFDIANTPFLIEWDYYKVIFPIPQSELNINPITQNDGYY